MDNPEAVLRAFQKNRDVGAVLDSGVLRDEASFRTHIQTLPEKEQTELYGILADLGEALASYIKDKANEMGDVKAQIDGTIKSAQACISYGTAQGLSPRSKREKDK